MAIGGMCICVYIFLLWNGAREHAEIRKLDDSQNYVIDFSLLLGEGWKVSNLIKDDEDISSWDINIAGRTQLWTYSVRNPLANVRHHVITYSNIDHALQRYLRQEGFVFGNHHSVSTNQPSFSYENINFPINTNPHADKQHIACLVVPKLNNTECAGLFLYGNHVIFADISTIVDSVEYLTMTDLQKIFSAIDEKMVSTT